MTATIMCSNFGGFMYSPSLTLNVLHLLLLFLVCVCVWLDCSLPNLLGSLNTYQGTILNGQDQRSGQTIS